MMKGTNMDDDTLEALTNIIQALKALAEVIEKSINFGMADGTGDMMIKQYRGLYFRATQILPDDKYVREFLGVEPVNKASDEQKIVQTQMLSEQLLLYLRGLVKGYRTQHVTQEEGRSRELGRELRNQIITATREAVKRFL